MPRQPESKTMGTQFYHSHFSSAAPYNPTPASVIANPSSVIAPISQRCSHPQSPPADSVPPKKKHVCSTCDRAFTTSGHLARHSRVHTGERNHKCPFPGCETRCSRQDNLQQHYRIHLSPGSRRSSTRSAIARAMNNNSQSPAGSKRSVDDFAPPPLSSPPSLEPARTYSLSTPPDSPPMLAQATLPATAHLPPDSDSTRSSSSPEIPYSPVSHTQVVSMNAQSTNGGHNTQTYSHYRSGTTTYQEQSQGAGFTYVHTTPISHSTGSSNANSHGVNGTSYSFSNSHQFENHSSHSAAAHHQSSSAPSTHNSSRHSISHISHPHSYSNGHQSNNGPPSPESTTSQHSSSHGSSSASGPTTPTYTGYNEDGHYGVVIEPSPELSGMGGGHVNSQGHLVSNGYTSSILHQQGGLSRFDSPPPILAPIQNDRATRGEQRMPPYLHHPQPISNEYNYNQPHMGHGGNNWKVANGLREKTLVQ